MYIESVLAISTANKTEPTSSQTPTIDTTMEHIDSASRKGQRFLRAMVSIVLPSSRIGILSRC